MIVVADTSPLNYLVIIGQIDILPALYQRVYIPAAVHREMLHQNAPAAVKQWLVNLPDWLEVRPNTAHAQDLLIEIDAGERAAIFLAEELHATLLIIDDFEGRSAAQERGLVVVGTLGVLRDAARAGIINMPDAIRRLQENGFHVSNQVLEDVLRDI